MDNKKLLIIKGLFGEQDFFIDLSKNINIIVGENGTGKSTLLNIFFALLTKQWDKLLKYNFKSITVSHYDLNLTKEDIKRLIKFRVPRDIVDEDRLRRYEMHRRILMLQEMDDLQRSVRGTDYKIALEFDNEHISPVRYIDEYFKEKNVSRKEKREREILNTKLNKFLKEYEGLQFVFLPTYRRIEKEIEKFLPKDRDGDVNEDFITGNRSKAGYVEIYGSGMADVHRTILNHIKGLREMFHSELNSLTQTYIKDVINEEYKKIDPHLNQTIQSISARDLTQYLQASFSNNEIEKILDFIGDFEERSKQEENSQFSYFIGKLLSLYTIQLERESAIISYFEMCNSYFVDGNKIEFTFDREKFEYSITKYGDIDNKIIALSDLSSGQKQIVSLFSHIYLGGQDGYYIVIDEPELSISVRWQKRILRDLYQHKKCKGILAVTHSPFVFDNNLINSVSSIHKLRGFDGQFPE